MITNKIFKVLISETNLISKTIPNILSLRELGNKLHGDCLEVAISHLISTKTDYSAIHVGKEFFRSGWDFDIIVSNDQDALDKYVDLMRNMKVDKVSDIKLLCSEYNIKYTNKKDTLQKLRLLIESKMLLFEDEVEHLSLKCYGKGPLQLSTSSNGLLIDECFKYVDDKNISQQIPLEILQSKPFNDIITDNILSVIYNEKTMNFSIMLIQFSVLLSKVKKITYTPRKYKPSGKVDTYEIFKFYGDNNEYLFEVRYGKAGANALQRGLWTKTTDIKNDSFDYICFDEPYEVQNDFLEEFKNLLIS